ncbi:MAG TPA: hemerythrin domain-containing protein [Acidimicrobiales bacterium]|nr:hemerythrin domain-containing protein [Acidimicrobiales bacterium]
MATIIKVMFDDHSRIKRLFDRAKRMPNDLDTAIAICQELDIHTTIEEEIVYPALEELDGELARDAEEDHEKANAIIDTIYKMEPLTPELRPAVEQLERIVSRHVEWEERVMFPLIKTELRNEVDEMGRLAFARRQEELSGIGSPRRLSKSEVAPNSGWGNSGWGGTVASAGW